MDRGADIVKNCGHHDSSDERAENVCSVYFRLFEMFISVGEHGHMGRYLKNESEESAGT